MEIKQVIIVRKDLKLSKGKLASQVAHAAISAAEKSKWKDEWLKQGQKKVVLKCNSKEELLELYEKAKEMNLPSELIYDAGKTQLEPGTLTCVGIGPAPSEEIDKLTRNLKLL